MDIVNVQFHLIQSFALKIITKVQRLCLGIAKNERQEDEDCCCCQLPKAMASFQEVMINLFISIVQLVDMLYCDSAKTLVGGSGF